MCEYYNFNHNLYLQVCLYTGYVYTLYLYAGPKVFHVFNNPKTHWGHSQRRQPSQHRQPSQRRQPSQHRMGNCSKFPSEVSARLDSVLAVCANNAGNVSARFDPQLSVLLAGLWPELTKGWG